MSLPLGNGGQRTSPSRLGTILSVRAGVRQRLSVTSSSLPGPGIGSPTKEGADPQEELAAAMSAALGEAGAATMRRHRLPPQLVGCVSLYGIITSNPPEHM